MGRSQVKPRMLKITKKPKVVNEEKSNFISSIPETLEEAIFHAARSSYKTPPKALADQLKISYTRLMNSTSVFNGVFRFPVKRLLPLMMITQNFLPLEFLAKRCNFVLTELPRVIEKDGRDVFISGIKLQEAAHLLSLRLQALSVKPGRGDDHINYLNAVCEDCYKLIQRAAQLQADAEAALEQKQKKGGVESVEQHDPTSR